MSRKDLTLNQLKPVIKNSVRNLKDLLHGDVYKFARPDQANGELAYVISDTQVVKTTISTKSKVHNLKIAIQQIHRYTLQSGETFSFWKAVGSPSKKRGYQEGRTLIKGELVTSVGGGLCQLSGMIYGISLKAGLDVLERHHHSVDIYTDETRFAPLGSDAAVVYGYKDLRIRNNQRFPIQFRFELEQDQLIIKLKSKQEITKQQVDYSVTELTPTEVQVQTQVNDQVIDISIYKKQGV